LPSGIRINMRSGVVKITWKEPGRSGGGSSLRMNFNFLLSHQTPLAAPSAPEGLASVFGKRFAVLRDVSELGMGTVVSLS
jgi:hypothetical protein